MIGNQLHNGVPYHPSVPKKVWRKVRKTIIIDSRDRQMNPGSHAGSYTVTLPTVYQNIYAATLKSIELPLTYYQFSSAINNVTLLFSYGIYGNAATPLTLKLPDGNYSVSQLAATLNTQFDTVLTAASLGAVTTGSLTASYSSITGKMTFTGMAAFTFYMIPPTPVSANGGNSLTVNYTTWWGLGYFLGFTASTQTSIRNTATNYTLTGQFTVNPFPTNYVLMDLDILNKMDETSLDGLKAWKVNGAFAKILANGNSGDFVYLTDTNEHPLNRTVYTPPISKLTNLIVKFRLHDGRIIDFNGVEHSFTIELEMLDNNFDEFSSVEFSV